MRALRYVRAGDDADHVILETADGSEQFVLSINVALRDAIRSDLPRLSPVQAAPAIGPREIQMRVRAGESPRELAEANAMTLERVLRFAEPVLAERARITDEARRARARRSTTEGQTVIFGEAVDERFGAHGIDATAVGWDSRRRDDGQWIVSAHWTGGAAERAAEWLFHLSGRAVTPLDDTAADLLSDRPIRPSVPAVVAPEPARLAAAPPLAPGVVAFPNLAQVDTSPLPAVDDVFDQDALEVDPAFGDAAPEDDYATPPLPLHIAEPARSDSMPAVRANRPAHLKNLGVAHRDDETDDEKAARAHIPSWDDILLGVRRKGD